MRVRARSSPPLPAWAAVAEGATKLQERGLTLIHAYTLVITDLLSQCWENEEFQVTLISLSLITRASPPGTWAGKCI